MRTLAALLSAFALNCTAAPFAVQLGDARVALDAPPGYADTTSIGSPRLQELAESLTSPSNRILLFAISDGDMRRFMVGETPDFRRYMVAVTPRGAERDRVTPDLFQRFVAGALAGMGKPPASIPDVAAYLESQPPGETRPLAELRRDASVVSVLQGVRIPGKKKGGLFTRGDPSTYVMTSTTLILLRGKALNLTVFTHFESPADLEWIRATTLSWTQDLQRLNQR